MRSVMWGIVIAAGGLAFAALGRSDAAGKPQPDGKPATWEYLEDFADFAGMNSGKLNFQGEKGWELVAAVADNQGRIRYTFKRPKGVQGAGQSVNQKPGD